MTQQGKVNISGQWEVAVRKVQEALAGNVEIANNIHYKLLDLYNPLYAEGNPVGIKGCLSLLNICSLHVRPPLVSASDKILAELERLL